MRCIFLGSPPFAMPVFERLLESGHDVLALVTRPDKPRGRGRGVTPSVLVELAQARGVSVLQPESTKDAKFLSQLRALGPDVLLVASYGEILRQEMLDLAPHGALNVHGSLLPRWRGAAPIQRAIAEGDRETGVSVQRMVLALDAGDVLLKRRTPIAQSDTAGSLFDRLAEMGGEAAVSALDQLEQGTATFTPQDVARVTHAGKLLKTDGNIAWARPAEELERMVRAMHPWPGARALTPDKTALIIEAAALVERVGGQPGELLEVSPRCLVATGKSALELLQVKPAGKRAMDAGSWLRGARLEVGARLLDAEIEVTPSKTGSSKTMEDQ